MATFLQYTYNDMSLYTLDFSFDMTGKNSIDYVNELSILREYLKNFHDVTIFNMDNSYIMELVDFFFMFKLKEDELIFVMNNDIKHVNDENATWFKRYGII